MTFTEAAAHVLRLVGKPLHYKEITDVAIEKNLLSHVGKSPEVTMGARLAAIAQKGEKDADLVRVKPGVFALREWDDATIKKGLKDRTPALQRIAKTESEEKGADAESSVEPVDDDGDEDAAVSAGGPAADGADEDDEDEDDEDEDDEDDEDDIGDDERERAERVAGANDVFAAEEDDDEPIFGGAGGEDDDGREGRGEGGGRRRRRRRRRKGGGEPAGSLPSYTVSEAGADNAPPPAEDPAPLTDDGAGKDVADRIASMLSRRNGTTSLRQLAEATQRRGRGGNDLQNAQSMISAAARADNLRRSAQGVRPRFRIVGGRIGLTDALLDDEALRLEDQAMSAVGRYREAVRRTLLKRLQELPTRAFGELVVLLLERLGMTDLRTVQRAGVHGSELHMSGVSRGPLGALQTAILVRRDGREVGRERVTELRGALHHYGNAASGLIVTAGQVLSGARDEASVSGASPVALIDGLALAKHCEEHGVAVTITTVPLPVPDLDLLDSLRSG